MSLTQLVIDLIDLRSFSNLWYWIALAVTWSTTSHWVLGVPFDMVARARHHDGQAMDDLETLVRINLGRMFYIVDEAGLILVGLGFAFFTALAMLGFLYGVEFCQAVFLLTCPLALVAFLSVRTGRRIVARQAAGEALCSIMTRHRIAVQAIGVVSIAVTAFWGMLQNFAVSPLG